MKRASRVQGLGVVSVQVLGVTIEYLDARPLRAAAVGRTPIIGTNTPSEKAVPNTQNPHRDPPAPHSIQNGLSNFVVLIEHQKLLGTVDRHLINRHILRQILRKKAFNFITFWQ